MEREELLLAYKKTRKLTMELVADLTEEDWRIQTIPEVSPHWWCLGHTSWFFARNILVLTDNGSDLDDKYDYVLNSYYESLGPRIAQKDRGKLSKPTNDEIRAYRKSVDTRMEAFITEATEELFEKYKPILEIGIHHENQHQELLVTELKHIQWQAPKKLRRAFATSSDLRKPVTGEWITLRGGLQEIGSKEGWAWDIEKPRHKVHLIAYEMMNRTVTNREFIEFITDGGYTDPLNWSYNGWELCKQKGWEAPLYWYQHEGTWWNWTLQGDKPVGLDEPVMHISYYEAQAFARWAAQNKKEYQGARLPTEQEWEHYANNSSEETGTILTEEKLFHPSTTDSKAILGGVWEWTATEYTPYPGFRPYDGPLIEYNEKFMDKQKVLRGGSIATPKNEIRNTNRNFWVQETRFQFSGMRLARDTERKQK